MKRNNLKVAIILVLFSSLSLLIFSYTGLSCKCGWGKVSLWGNVYDAYHDSNCNYRVCGFDKDDTDGWICLVEKVDNPCSGNEYLGSSGSCGSGDDYFDNKCYAYASKGAYTDGSECLTSRSVCRNNKCPNYNSWNGHTCHFADGAAVWGGASCHSKKGKWNAYEKACVQCNSDHTRKYLLAKGSTRCWNYDASGWQQYSCAYEGAGTCDYGCGADIECNRKSPDTFYDTNSDDYKDLYCSDYCYAYKCNSDNECTSKGDRTCIWYIDGNGNGHWYWYPSTSPYTEDGSPWQECFDKHDNDCDKAGDCADSGCDCVLNGDHTHICANGQDNVCNSGNCGKSVTCKSGKTYYCVYTSSEGWHWSTSKPSNFCCVNDDCGYDSNTHIKGYCDLSSYTCKYASSCDPTNPCEDGYCCTYYITGQKGSCKKVGSVYNYNEISYLCVKTQ